MNTNESKVKSKGKRVNFWFWISLVLVIVIGCWWGWQKIFLSEPKDTQGNAKKEQSVDGTAKNNILVTEEEDTSEKIEQQNSWYDNLLAKATKLNYMSYDGEHCRWMVNSEMQDAICPEGNIKPENIGEIYYSADKKIVLAIVTGSYGGVGFKLLKYDLNTNDLLVASREDIVGGSDSNWKKIAAEFIMPDGTVKEKSKNNWFSPPRRITSLSLDGQKYGLAGSEGDAGCMEYSSYEYDIEKNYIRITELCTSCADQAESCQQY